MVKPRGRAGQPDAEGRAAGTALRGARACRRRGLAGAGGLDQPARVDSRQINRVTGILLAAGLTAAAVVYLVAEPETLDPLLGDPMKSKRHLHDLAVIGGKTNVLTVEFIEWVKRLSRGRRWG